MIKLENTEVLGWEAAIRGMRNPMNSWERSDSSFCTIDSKGECRNPKEYLLCEDCDIRDVTLGSNDHDLMMRLAKGGPVHAKYRRMIVVYVDITAPLYWWKEFDTYKVGTVANSCSTMHKIAAKEFTLEDFSCEHLMDDNDYRLDNFESLMYEDQDAGNTIHGYNTGDLDDNSELCYLNSPLDDLKYIIGKLNVCRRVFLDDSIQKKHKKTYWWQMIQLLPSSYNQKRTVMMNYEVLAGIYPMRKNHKLDEWHTFCDWIEELPYSEIITGYEEEEDK